jgi:hypothetical protein
MRTLLTLCAVLLLFASIATGAGSRVAPVETQVPSHPLSEPATLVIFGAGFVLLAKQVRKKRC